MRITIEEHVVSVHEDKSIRLIDDIGRQAASAVVVTGVVGEVPGITVDAGIDMHGTVEIQSGQGLAIDSSHCSGRRVPRTVVGDVVRCNLDRDIGLVDDIRELAGLGYVIRIVEGPAIAVYSGIGVGRGNGEIAARESTVHANYRTRGRMHDGVIVDVVRRHLDRGVRLVDDIRYRTMGVIVVLSTMEEPRIGVGPGVGVLGLGEIEIANWIDSGGGVYSTVVGDIVGQYTMPVALALLMTSVILPDCET